MLWLGASRPWPMAFSDRPWAHRRPRLREKSQAQSRRQTVQVSCSSCYLMWTKIIQHSRADVGDGAPDVHPGLRYKLYKPSCNRAASLSMSRDQGGSHTSSTVALFTCGIDSICASTC